MDALAFLVPEVDPAILDMRGCLDSFRFRVGRKEPAVRFLIGRSAIDCRTRQQFP